MTYIAALGRSRYAADRLMHRPPCRQTSEPTVGVNGWRDEQDRRRTPRLQRTRRTNHDPYSSDSEESRLPQNKPPRAPQAAPGPSSLGPEPSRRRIGDDCGDNPMPGSRPRCLGGGVLYPPALPKNSPTCGSMCASNRLGAPRLHAQRRAAAAIAARFAVPAPIPFEILTRHRGALSLRGASSRLHPHRPARQARLATSAGK